MPGMIGNQPFAVMKWRSVRADLDQVEEPAALVLNRIGADLLEIGLKLP